MHLGVILPHVKLYGGVKRFFELGRHFIDSGHRFTVYTPEGIAPLWIKTKVESASFEQLKNEQLDVLFVTEIGYVDLLRSSNAKRKIFYHVRQSDPMKKVIKYPEIEVFACSTNIYLHDKNRYGFTPFLAVGGVNTTLFYPKSKEQEDKETPLTIMSYGRLSVRRKGTQIIVKACELLYKKGYNIRLLLFDTPVDAKMQKAFENFKTSVPYEFVIGHPIDKNYELFHEADIFVAAEKKAGWGNTVAEAMACGTAVIATKSATLDILKDKETGIVVWRNRFSIARAIKKLIKNPELRNTYAENGRKHIEQFDWKVLADKILKHLES